MTKLQITLAGAVLVAAMATSLVVEHQSLNQAREENNRMRAENGTLQSQAEQLAALTAENQRLSNLVARTQPAPAAISRADQSEVLRLRGKVTQLQADAKTNARSAGNRTIDALANPAMKGMMQASYSAAVDRTYAEFFANAQLTPEQLAGLKELIRNKENLHLDMALSLLSGKADPAQAREAVLQSRARSAQYDEQIKQLLGDDGYQQLQTFEKTKNERMLIGMMENQMPVGSEMSPDQKKQIVTAMMEERQSYKFTVDLADESSYRNPANFSEAGLKQYAEEHEQLRQRYVARASEILSPDQLAVFDQYLKNQQQVGIAAVEASAKLFVPKAGN